MARNNIHVSKLPEYRPDALEGVKLVHRHGLLSDLLRDSLPPDRASFLAEPMEDAEKGLVYWFSDLPGEPKPYPALNPEEKKYADEILSESVSEFEALAKKLSAYTSSNKVLSGTEMKKLVEGADYWNLYMLGDRLVAASWGMIPNSGKRERGSELTEGSGIATPPPPVLNPVVPPPDPGAYGPYPRNPVEPEKRRGCLGFLLFPLFLLLPLLLLFLLLCFLFPGFLAALFPALFPALVPAPEVDRDREAALRQELRLLKNDYLARFSLCPSDTPRTIVPDAGEDLQDRLWDDEPHDLVIPETAGEGTSPGIPGAVGVGIPGVLDGSLSGETTEVGVAVGTDEGAGAEDEAAGIDAGIDAGVDAGTDPPGTDESRGADDAARDDRNAQNEDLRGVNPENRHVDIPEDAKTTGDVSWLSGCWNYDTKLYNLRTKAPLTHTYCFDDKGNADVRVRELDERGNVTDTCLSKAQARILDGNLVIRELGIPICEEGGAYRSSTITCVPGDSRTECQIEQDGVAGKESAEIYKE
ncbi:MAG: hypothetical protein LBF41_07360 [Deltaproteobacteria bacterium]|jgi:hypothetical protein|nr:hypothetical protein [Deltaproteobacteria bacterium]